MADETPPTPATPAAAVVAPPAPPAAPAPPPAAPAPPVPPAPAPPPVAPPPPAQSTVTLTDAQFQTFVAGQARLAQMEADQANRDRLANEKATQALMEKGQAEEALRLTKVAKDAEIAAEKTKLGELESRAKRYALDGELARALASHPLVPGALEQLGLLWRGQFTAQAEGDSFTVRTPQFQSVPDYIAAQLARPEYQHFLRAQGNPGGGSAGSTSSAAAPAPTPAVETAPPPGWAPKNLGEALLADQKSRLAEGPGGGDPRKDVRAPFGLRAVGA